MHETGKKADDSTKAKGNGPFDSNFKGFNASPINASERSDKEKEVSGFPKVENSSIQNRSGQSQAVGQKDRDIHERDVSVSSSKKSNFSR